MEAALKGAGQIGFTIVSLTVSLIAVLIPLLVHGRRGGPPLPRIRRHPGRHHHHLRRGLADPHAHDVRAHSAPQSGGTSRGGSTAHRRHVFERMIAFYGRTLKLVLRYQTITLLVALATLVLTVFLYIVIPKGFFPVQDTGVIQGISQAPQSISFTAMAAEAAGTGEDHPCRTRRLQSLSSFIGADGTNTTLNSGRISINLKPLDQRDLSASDVIRRLQEKLGDRSHGIQLYMQPVQNITVDDRVSRTQYQYTLEDPDSRRAERLDQPLRDEAEEVARAGRRRHRPADRAPVPSRS